MDKKAPPHWNLMYLWLGFMMPTILFAQADPLPPEGIPKSVWKQANQRWEVIQYPARIIALDRSVALGQIYAIEDDSLLLWPSEEIFVPGSEVELVGVSVGEIDSIYIHRKRSFWRGAWKGALIGGVPAMVLSLENADGDFLPPVVQVLLVGTLAGGPVGLVNGLIHKAGQVKKAYRLSGDPTVDRNTLDRVKKYALYPLGRPARGEIKEDHPLSFSPELQEFEQSLDHSPVLKKLFPSRGFNLELYGGAGYRSTANQMIASLGQTTNLYERLDPLIIGGELMLKVRPHWRTGVAVQYSREARMSDSPPFTEENHWRYTKTYSLKDPVFLAGIAEYVHQPMHRLLIQRWEWGVGGGVSVLFTEKRLSAGYALGRTHFGELEELVREKVRLPGLLLQSRLRFYPQKNLSIGIKGQLHGVLPFPVDALVFDPATIDPSFFDDYFLQEFPGASTEPGPPVRIEASRVNLSSVVLLGTIGVHL